ncbi:EAL domain-containing protein [Catenovulum sp. SX2]|uniref:EAL domain-containing protein n=1 Tax=Catenovulum sp. SX2 TaxID=3398614 RepID=UPI003F8450B7
MVHSYSQDFDWTVKQQQAFTKQLQKLNGQQTLRFSSEYLDTKRIEPSSQYITLFQNYLVAKYQKFQPDLIYVTDDNAAKFVLGLKPRIFSNTPIVFSGVSNTELLKTYPFQQVSGVYEKPYFAEYVKILSELYPNISTIYYVGDGSVTDQYVGEQIDQLKLDKSITIKHVQKQYLAQIVDFFVQAQPGPIILGTAGSLKNVAGEILHVNDTIRALSNQLNRPILVSMNYVDGALGGFLFAEQFGFEAAHLAHQYLSGAPTVSTIDNLQPQLHMDYNQIKRFGLNVSHPVIARAIVHNKPKSIFETHQNLLFWLGQISIVLTIFITVFSYLMVRQRNQLIVQQSIDPLTQLSNRLALSKDVVSTGETFALININAFSSLNHFYGTAIGNRLLVATGDLLMSKSSQRIKAYRLNADQFGLLFSHTYTQQQVTRYLTHLIEQFESTELLPEVGGVTLTVSVGATIINDDRYIEQAREAMARGRRQQQSFAWYQLDEQKVQQQAHNAKWVNKLKSALNEHRLVAYYQPIVDISSGQIKSYEMLARIHEEDGGVITPNLFIDIAKRTQQYHRLTRQMIDHALLCIKQYKVLVSINFTMQDIGHAPTVEYLVAQLESSLAGHFLTLEITETEGIENYALVKQFVQQVKTLGCSLAIDDFGTGYSNFSHLLDLNADVIKLDGSLIQRLLKDEKTEQIVKLLVAFAHSNNMAVTAEFVDSQELLDKLAELAVDSAQGFHLGKPAATIVSQFSAQVVN